MYPLRSIVIVGGGTAGWLAACYLQRRLGQHGAGPRIRLIESQEIGIIGVGEATVPTLRHTLAAIGIGEAEFLRATDGLFKQGIRFHGWRNGGAPGEDRYDHPFDMLTPVNGLTPFHHWLNLWQRGQTTTRMADACTAQTALYDAFCTPKLAHSAEYQAPVPYAYHLDAVKLAHLLREVGTGRGVEHVIGDVVRAERGHDDGDIAAVHLADGSRHEADLFVDCTGFRALLIGKTLQSPWISFADTLPCDRAIACPVAHPAGAELRPFTVSTAQPAGWTWDVDLQTRRGTGYVYASAFCSDDEAIATLRHHHGQDQAIAEPRLLRMRVGHFERVWEHNCVAIGLASGFIEPLESTAIYLIEYALEQFVDHLPASMMGAAQCRARYNRAIGGIYSELRDFVMAHYVLSGRRDTAFWRACTEGARLPDSLAELLATWDAKLPTLTDLEKRRSLFGPNSWFCILAGLGRLPVDGSGLAAHVPAETSTRVLEQVLKVRREAVRQSVPLRQALRDLQKPTPAYPR